MFATLLVGFGAAGLVVALVVLPQTRDRVRRNVAEALSPPVAYLAEALAEAWQREGDFGVVLERARERFATPVAVVPRQGLTLQQPALARLDAGEVVQTQDFVESVMLAHIPGTDQVLRVGPINPVHPFGEGRGATVLILFVVGLAVGVFLLVEPIRRRLRALARTTEAFGHGDLSVRARSDSRDAIGALSRSFNDMAGQIERLVAAHQHLLRMVSHELRTPLQRLHFNVERIRDAPALDARENALDHMASDLDELEALIEELLTYVRLKDQGPVRREVVAVAPLLRELCATLSPLGGGIALAAAPQSEALVVNVEARLLKRALSNLIVNALRHARGRVEVRASNGDGRVRFEVDDDGPGIRPADRERIFEPFQRLDDDAMTGRGFGLGLAIVRRVAEVHDGTIEALESDLGGARLRLNLPER